MKRDEIKEKIPGISGEALDWLMSRQAQDLQQQKDEQAGLSARADALAAQLAEANRKLTDYDPDWRKKASQERLNSRLEAAIEKAGGRSQKAVRALLDLDTLQNSQNPDADIPAAVSALKDQCSWLFDAPAPAAYSGQVGTAAQDQPSDSALRAAFGL